MKKLSFKYRKWLINRARNERIRKHSRRGIISGVPLAQLQKEQRAFYRSLSPEELSTKMTPVFEQRAHRLEPPAIFSLEKNFDETADFLSLLREQTAENLKIRRKHGDRGKAIKKLAGLASYVDFRCDLRPYFPPV